jgi:tRNA C32,U32 (ribose-2'-O)-methylase TrmJ
LFRKTPPTVFVLQETAPSRRRFDVPGSRGPNAADASRAVPGRDVVEPATVVEDMASAIGRVRRMAATVFEGDAALFADPPSD